MNWVIQNNDPVLRRLPRALLFSVAKKEGKNALSLQCNTHASHDQWSDGQPLQKTFLNLLRALDRDKIFSKPYYFAASRLCVNYFARQAAKTQRIVEARQI